MSSEHCVFCAIVAGRIPSLRVMETPECLAFLDVEPLAPGHTLLVPKAHYRDMLELQPEELAMISAVLPRLSRAILSATGTSGLNILQNNGPPAGQVVMHFHFHLIPRVEGDGLGFRWKAGKYVAEQGQSMRDRLVESLRIQE